MALPKRYEEYFEDLKEYEGLNAEEKKWLYQFYLESYRGNNVDDPARILKSPVMVKDARRQHNSAKRDAFNVARTTQRMKAIDQVNDPVNRKFMDDVSRENEWMTAFKIGGYELAGKHIVNDTVEQIKICEDDTLLNSILLNMILDLRKLRIEYDRDRRDKKQKAMKVEELKNES